MKKRLLVLLATGVMGLLFFAAPHSAHAQDSGECYPPTAECVTTTTIGVVATTAAQAPSASGDELARTGSDTTIPYTAIAAVLIAGGGLAVIATRKRASNRTNA